MKEATVMKGRIMKRAARLLTVTLVVAMLSVFAGSGSVAKASPDVRWQVAFLIDGSGSISTLKIRLFYPTTAKWSCG
jgi:hypothetical protein